MKYTAEYEALVRDLQGRCWRQKAWGTRVLKGDAGCLQTMWRYLDNNQTWEKNTSPTVERKKLRHDILMHIPVELLPQAIEKLQSSYGYAQTMKSWDSTQLHPYSRFVMTAFESAMISSSYGNTVNTEGMTDAQVARCALVRMLSCRG